MNEAFVRANYSDHIEVISVRLFLLNEFEIESRCFTSVTNVTANCSALEYLESSIRISRTKKTIRVTRPFKGGDVMVVKKELNPAYL